MILDALRLGFNVLHTDVDMVYFADPLPDVQKQCPKSTCDVAPLWDSIVYNEGFIFIRSSPAGIRAFERMKKIADTTKNDDQVALNSVIKQASELSLRYVKLPVRAYLSGKAFYEDGQRVFGDTALPCTACIVAHNNWIVSIEAKIYRFREMQQWVYDGPDQYYTSTERKYLTYTNAEPVSAIGVQIRASEVKALANALAISQLLNRTLILPRFHTAKGVTCTLLNHLMLSHFDGAFRGEYRESTFLDHPLVPALKASSSITIQTDDVMEESVYKPKDTRKGATSEEILNWFSGRQEPLLRFTTLYNAFHKFTDLQTQQAFDEKFKRANVKGNYRQYV
jgi:hypothetical protein